MAERINDFGEFSDVSFYGRPELSELTNWIGAEIPAQWEEVGTLLKIPQGKLEAIKVNTSCGGDPKKMFCEVMKLWKDNPHPEAPYNWDTILSELTSNYIGKVNLAQQVAERVRYKALFGTAVQETREETEEIDFTEHISFLKSLHNKMEGIKDSYAEANNSIKSTFEEAIKLLTEATGDDNLKFIPEVQAFVQELKEVKKDALKYLNKVDDIYWKTQQNCDSVIRALQSGNRKKLDIFVEDLKKILKKADKRYRRLLEKIPSLVNTCNAASIKCERQAIEEEKKCTRAKVGGGIATGVTTVGVGAVGITASVLVGIFTAGIGTAIGVPLTLAATGTAAAGTVGLGGGATFIFAKHFKKNSAQFKRVGDDFSKLNDSKFSKLQNQIEKILTVHTYTRQNVIAVLTELDRTAKRCYKETSKELANTTKELQES